MSFPLSRNFFCSSDACVASTHSVESSQNSRLRRDATQASPLPKKASRRGFTLVEVLATMMLMALVLPALMRGATIALSAASSARHRTEAASLAEAKLNELIALGTWQGGSSGDFAPEHPDYHWTSAVPAARDYGISDVSMTVTWTEGGVERKLVLTTLMYDTTQTATPSGTSTGGTIKGLPQ